MKELVLSRPLFAWAWVCLGALAVLLLAPSLAWALAGVVLLAAAGLALPSWRPVAFLVGTAVLGGVIAFLLWQLRSAPVERLAGMETRLEGVVLQEEKGDGYARYLVYGSGPQLEGRRVRVWVISFRSLDLEPGEEAAGTVSLSLPRDEESRRYRYAQGVLLEGEGELTAAATGWGGSLQGRIARLRQRMLRALEEAFPSRAASLTMALLLSDDSRLDPALLGWMRQCGTAHLLVVSGYHVSLLLGGLTAVLGKLRCRPWISMPICLGVLTGFCALVGFTPSVVRASVMGGACLLAQGVGREKDSLTALALAALVLLFANPYCLLSWSFLLSFSTTLSVVVFAGPILEGMTARARAARRRIPRPVEAAGAVIGVSLAASVLGFPVQAVMFGWVPVLAPLANLLVAPFVPLLFFLGGAAVLLDLAGLSLPAVAAQAAELAAWIVEGCSRAMASVPGVSLPVNQWWVVLWLFGAAGILLLARALPFPRRRVRWLSLLAVPLLVGLLLDALLAGGSASLLTPRGEGSLLVERGGQGLVVLDGLEEGDSLEELALLARRSGVEQVQLLVCPPGTQAAVIAQACRLLEPEAVLLPREEIGKNGLRLPDSLWVGPLEESRAQLLGGVVCPVELGEGTIALEIGGAKVLKLLGGYDIIRDKTLLEGASLLVAPSGEIYSLDPSLTPRTLAAGQRQVGIGME